MSSPPRSRYLETTPPPGVRARGALVLLHAFPMNARMWEPQRDEFARGGWRVIAPQFRGFDRLDGSDGAPIGSMDDYAGDIVDLLDALHIEETVVAGLSMGGYVAFALLRLAARYVQALVLADTRPQADTPQAAEGRTRLAQTARDQGAGAVADEMLPRLLGETTRQERPEVVALVRSLAVSSSPAALTGALEAMRTRPDSTPLLATIHVPTLVVVGEEDVVTPPDVAREMHRAIAGSDLAIVTRAGHLSNLENTSGFNRAVAEFLEHRV
jgi:pimeloyl-ACP methyl ester carboxylesterase